MKFKLIIEDSQELKLIKLEGEKEVKLNLMSNEIKEAFSVKASSKFNKDGGVAEDFGFCHVFYDDLGKSKAIEFFEPSQIIFNGVQLINSNYLKIEEFFKQLDDNLCYLGGAGFCSLKLQLGVFAPSAPNGNVETVLLGRKGYYDALFD